MLVAVMLAALSWSAPVLAQDPENPAGTFVVLGTNCASDPELELWEWVETSNANTNLSAELKATICLPQAGQTGSVLLQYELVIDGYTTSASYPYEGTGAYMAAFLNRTSGTLTADIYDGDAGHLTGSTSGVTVRVDIATGPAAHPSTWDYTTTGYVRLEYADGAANGGNIFSVFVFDPLYWFGAETVRLRLIPWDAFSPGGTPTPTPSITPTPTPTPTPSIPMADPACDGVICRASEHCLAGVCHSDDVGARILAVPDGCDGIEVLPDSWGLVPVDSTWVNNVANGYSTGYRVRWTFRAEVGRSHSANVNVNGYLMGLSWSGPSAGEDMYYEVTWPTNFTENPAALLANNTGAETIMIASICLEPTRTVYSCINPDPEFNNPADWEVSYPAYINNGFLNLRPGGWARQQQYVTAGNYRIQLAAQSDTNQRFTLSIGPGFSREVNVPAGGVPTAFWYDFDMSFVQNPIMGLQMSYSASPDANIRISHVCLSLRSLAPTPTPPPPSPTPVPPPQSCDNAGYDFSMPSLWTMDGAEIVTQSDGKNVLLLFRNSGAYQTIGLPQGQYVLTVRAARGSSSGNIAGFDVVYGYTPIGEWVIHPDIPIQEVREYVAVTYLSGGTHQLWISALPGYYGGTIHSVCLSYLGNPNPQPTPTPGPTPTPETTPWPDPAYCVNPDSGLDTNDHWVVIGSGYVDTAASQAILNAGDQLAADIQFDAQRDYDVTIAGYCTHASTSNIYWRGQMQTMLCVGANMPFNRTFLFIADSLTFVSSPLVDLLDPQSARGGIIPRDLPSGFAPQLFSSPLNLPAPPPPGETGTQHLMSPLGGQPAFPDADPRDALMATLSTIMQIQASSANGGQVVITSVCVKDRAWVPPADPPAISLYHPTCERDYGIQQNYTDLHRALLVGLGAQVGMPVHAVYGGTVSGASLGDAYTFGTVRYEGCVVIDHTAALNTDLQSVTCNLGTLAVGHGQTVARGQLIGYTSNRQNYGILGARGLGLALFAAQQNGDWVNPTGYLSGFVDCHPYLVVIEEIERCDADDGSGIIPPRYNMPAPSLWNPEQWVPWLARRLYDTVGYPILCALIPIINAIVIVIQDIANAIITVLTAPLLFLYRMGRIFEYLLALFGRVLTALWALFEDATRLTICFRSIITYFVSAMTAARDAQRPALELTPGPLLYAINLALLLISSTIANAILVPFVMLMIGYASWQLVPWGIRHIRTAIGAGE